MNISKIKKAGVLTIISFVSAGSLLAQSSELSDSAPSAGAVIGGAVSGLLGLLLGVLVIVGMWKIFVKAGQPGWASIIPIYNLYVLCQITAKPIWWLLLLILCPFINMIVLILLTLALAKSFGKGTGFALGMVFFPFVFYPILGFSDATYTAPQS